MLIRSCGQRKEADRLQVQVRADNTAFSMFFLKELELLAHRQKFLNKDSWNTSASGVRVHSTSKSCIER